jgi:hypothetical protein
MITNLKFTLATFAREKVYSDLRIFFDLNTMEFRVIIGIFLFQSHKKNTQYFCKKDIAMELRKITKIDHFHRSGFLDYFPILIKKGFICFSHAVGTPKPTQFYTINKDKFNYLLSIYQAFIKTETHFNTNKMKDYRVPVNDLKKASKDVAEHIKKLKKFGEKK